MEVDAWRRVWRNPPAGTDDQRRGLRPCASSAEGWFSKEGRPSVFLDSGARRGTLTAPLKAKEKHMAGSLSGYMQQEVGQVVEGPTLEEAESRVDNLLLEAKVAFKKYQEMQQIQHIADPEKAAHRAQVFSSLVGELAQAAYVLQRAAYLKATK